MATDIKQGYKQIKVGIIPNDWDIITINDCCNVLDNLRKPINKEERNKIWSWPYPYYGANWAVDYINEYMIDWEYILIAEDGWYFNDYETKPITYKINGKSRVNNHAHILKNKENFALDYIHYSLVHKNILNYINWSTRQKLNQEALKKIEIITPTNPKEQEKIANILLSVDELIEKTDKVIETQKKLKEGLLSKLMREGIGHTEFKDSKLGKIPKDWQAFSIEDCKDIIWIQDWNHWEIHPKSSDYVEKWIPFIMANCIKNWKVQYKNANCISYEQAQKLRIWFAKEWDILLTHKWTIWEVAIVPCIGDLPYIMLTPQVTYYRFNQNGKLLNQFLFYYFQSKNYQVILEKLAKQSTRNYIWITEQKKMYIPIPNNIEEQRKIIDILTSVDSSIIDEEQYRDSLKILKKWLMDKLLIGEIRVKL